MQKTCKHLQRTRIENAKHALNKYRNNIEHRKTNRITSNTYRKHLENIPKPIKQIKKHMDTYINVKNSQNTHPNITETC